MVPTLLTLSIDQAPPVATWYSPRASGTALQLAAVTSGTISIELADTGGSGIDLTTVTSANVIVTRGGMALVSGKDFSFATVFLTDSSHGDVNGQAMRIDLNSSGTGGSVWAGQYQITIVGVADKAGNVMAPDAVDPVYRSNVAGGHVAQSASQRHDAATARVYGIDNQYRTGGYGRFRHRFGDCYLRECDRDTWRQGMAWATALGSRHSLIPLAGT